MGSFNWVAVQKIVKEVYANKIEEALNNRFPYFERFCDANAKYKSGDGKVYVIPIRITRSQSTAAISDGGAIPAYNPPTFEQALVNVKYLAGSYNVTGPTIAGAESSRAAVKSALEVAKETFLIDFENRASRYIMLDGTGRVAQVSAGGGTTTLTLGGAVGYGTFYLEVGDVVAAVTTAGAWRGRLTVATVDHAANQITVTVDSGAVADTDYIVYCQIDSTTIGTTDYNKAPAGLGFSGGMLDASVAYENLDPATVPKWAPVAVAAGSVAVNQDLLDSLFLDLQTRSGSVSKMWHANSGFIPEMRNLVEDNRRYANLEVKTGTGSKIVHSVLGTDCEFFFDRFVPPNQIAAIDESCVYKFETRKRGFDEMYGGSFWKYTGVDAATAVYLWYMTIGTDQRWKHGRLTGLTQSKVVRPTLAG